MSWRRGEEMQSLNEELSRSKPAQSEARRPRRRPERSTNLLNSTETAPIFLDADLNIKRFTPATRAVANLIASDLGRPLSDIAAKLEGPPLMDDAREVWQSRITRSREIRSPEGTWYLMRALPYRTVTNTIGGVILTFSDVTVTKQAEAILREAQAYFESIVQTVREPARILYRELRWSRPMGHSTNLQHHAADSIARSLCARHGLDIPRASCSTICPPTRSSSFRDYPCSGSGRRCSS